MLTLVGILVRTAKWPHQRSRYGTSYVAVVDAAALPDRWITCGSSFSYPSHFVLMSALSSSVHAVFISSSLQRRFTLIAFTVSFPSSHFSTFFSLGFLGTHCELSSLLPSYIFPFMFILSRPSSIRASLSLVTSSGSFLSASPLLSFFPLFSSLDTLSSTFSLDFLGVRNPAISHDQ